MKQNQVRIIFLTFNSIFLISVFFGIPGQLKIGIRDSLFSTFIDNPDLFVKAPTEIQDFDWNKSLYRQQFIDYAASTININTFILSDTNFVDKIQKISLRYSKNGGDSCGYKSDDLAINIKWIHENQGHGCCSDHAQVFNALCILNGITVREVQHKSHTFNEAYDSTSHKWLWIDSQFCLMAKDEKGNFLSLYDMYLLSQRKQEINWVFFGTPLHQAYSIKPENISEDLSSSAVEAMAKINPLEAAKFIENETVYYFRPSEFRVIQMTMGNDIFKEDVYNKKYFFLPRELRQFLLLAFDIMPHYKIYDPEGLKKQAFEKTKNFILLTIIGYLIINIQLIRKMFKLYNSTSKSKPFIFLLKRKEIL